MDQQGAVSQNKNDVSVTEGILFYLIRTLVDEQEAIRLYKEGLERINREGLSKVLIDIRESTEFSSAARRIWVKFLQDPHIKKSAIFGGNVFVRTLASFVIAATQKMNVKFFATEQEARAWLREES